MIQMTNDEYAKLIAQRDALASALEVADKVIGVMAAHTDYLSDRDRQRMASDIANRGLADHETLRRQALAAIG